MSKFPKGEEITAVGFASMISTMPSATLVTLYCISKYYDKYRVTGWLLKALEKRGFTKEDMADFDENFTNFFEQMITQQDL
jgi:hypothetical protein